MKTDGPQPKSLEQSFANGQRSVWLAVLRSALAGIGPQAIRELAPAVEREEALVQLRSLCAKLEDNDWPNDMHLGDVIEMHVMPHLSERGIHHMMVERRRYKGIVEAMMMLPPTDSVVVAQNIAKLVLEGPPEDDG